MNNITLKDAFDNDEKLLDLANERMNNFNSKDLISSEDLYKELCITEKDLDSIGDVEVE